MMTKTIALDLDGVFANFSEFATTNFGQDYHAMDPKVFWGRASKFPGLFAKLSVLAGSVQLLNRLSHHNVYVLTALPIPTGYLDSADKDKRDWVARNMSPALRVETVVGGVNKGRFCRPGDFLIDDLARNIQVWESAGGVGILHRSVEETLEKCMEHGLLLP